MKIIVALKEFCILEFLDFKNSRFKFVWSNNNFGFYNTLGLNNILERPPDTFRTDYRNIADILQTYCRHIADI